MRTLLFCKVTALAGLLVLAGCAPRVTPADKYSGFLKDYSGLQETTSSTGKNVLRWADSSFDLSRYDSIVYNPIVYYPTPAPTSQISREMLDSLLNYTNSKLKSAMAQRKPLVTIAGPHSLIFRGAITGVSSKQEGLQFYEVIPVALVVAGAQIATGHRTMDTHLFLEGEFIDAATQKTVIKVVRMDEGKELRNENTPMTTDTLKQVIDNLASDVVMFYNKK